MDQIPIERELASRVRRVLRAIVRDLAESLNSPRYSTTAGLADAVAAILIPLRELDASLPGYDDDRVVEPSSLESIRRLESTCSVPISLPLDAARDLVLLATGHSRSLNQLLSWILNAIPNELRRPVTIRFGRVMGHLYTEIMHPLHLQHRELKALVFGVKWEEPPN